MKRVHLYLTAALIPFDYLTLLASAIIAYQLRFSDALSGIRPITFELDFAQYFQAAAIISLIWLLIFALSGLYSVRPHRIAVEMTRIILACSTGIAAVLAITFFSRDFFESRFIVLAIWVLSIVLIVIERLLIRGLQRSLYIFGVGQQQLIIIGKTKSGNALRDYFNHYPRLGFRIAGQFPHLNETTQARIRHLKRQDHADAILLANPEATREEMRDIKRFTDIEHLHFYYSADVFPSSAVHPILHTFAGQPVIEVPKTPLGGWGAIYKRGFDIVVSLILIILSLPVQIITAIALFIEQPGSVFFSHERVGQGGKPFRYFKFRSMVKDAHKYRFDPEFLEKHGNMRDGTPLFKLEHDPRVTRVGAFIRKFSIDEIPEFYLVLLGRMSLVGPRPHMPKEVDQYKPHQRPVLTIKPGITGMAQVGGRANLEFDEEVLLDVYYIENWSPWLDIVILLKTPIAVLFSRGAY